MDKFIVSPNSVSFVLKADRASTSTNWMDVKLEAKVVLSVEGNIAKWAYIELGSVGEIVGRSAKFELSKVKGLDCGELSRRKPDGALCYAVKFGNAERTVKVTTLEDAVSMTLGLYAERTRLAGSACLEPIGDWKNMRGPTHLADGRSVNGQYARFRVRKGEVLRLEHWGWRPSSPDAKLEEEEL